MKFAFAPLATLALLNLGFLSAAWAGPQTPETKRIEPLESSPFDRGMREFQFGAGAFFSLNNHGEKRPAINDVDASVRLGWMLGTPGGDTLWRGNCELLVELFGGAVVEGPGSGLGGGTLLLRYNFVQPQARWVPYLQLGAGGVYNDIYEDHVQRVIGRSVEFNLQGGLGLRYFCSPRCAVFVEADFRHISNADTADRNLGLNSVGGLIGGSFFF